jgi:hypothetical protein
MNHRAVNRQLPLWDPGGDVEVPAVLTREQQEELTSVLAELLLLNAAAEASSGKGGENAG